MEIDMDIVEWLRREETQIATEAADEIERLRDAMRFYANPDNYKQNWNEIEKIEFTTVEIDNGRQARAALKGDE
jgi:hypothetical protein